MTTGKTGFERLPLAFLAAMTFLLPGYGSPSSVPPAGTVEVYETPDIYQSDTSVRAGGLICEPLKAVLCNRS